MGSAYLGLIKSPHIESQTALGLNSSPGTHQLCNSKQVREHLWGFQVCRKDALCSTTMQGTESER